MAAEIIPNTRELRIANLRSLKPGTGARYVEVIRDHNGGLIAKAWKRTVPATGIVVDLDAPKIVAEGILREKGATLEKREDAHGVTRSGWWMDGVFLAQTKDPVLALDVLEGR